MSLTARSPRVWRTLSPPRRAAQAAGGLGALSPDAACPFPSAAPASVSACAGQVPAACVCSQELASSCDPPGWRMSTIQNLRKSLDRNWRPVCSVGGDAVSGAEFARFPSPLPPSSGGDGLVHRRLALLWSFSVPLFCKRLAMCSSQLIFSLAIPQFKKAPSDCSQGLRAGPYPKQCRPLLSVSPPLAGGGCGRLEYFSAGSCF